MAKLSSRQWYRMNASDVLLEMSKQKNKTVNMPVFLPKSAWPFYKYRLSTGNKISEVCIDKLKIGDVVLLRPGDIAPANIRLLESRGLIVQEDKMTGNAQPVKKNTYAIRSWSSPEEQGNMVFAGSRILRGTGSGVIVEVAQSTTLAKASSSKSSEAKKLNRAGIVIQHGIAKGVLNSIGYIIFDDLKQVKEITGLIQKIVISRGIPCVFFVDNIMGSRVQNIHPAIYSVGPMELVADDLNLYKAIMVIDAKEAEKLRLVSNLHHMGMGCMYVHRGDGNGTVAQVADLSLAIGTNIAHQTLYKASLLASSLKISTFAQAISEIFITKRKL